jgi:hypothetical protein
MGLARCSAKAGVAQPIPPLPTMRVWLNCMRKSAKLTAELDFFSQKVWSMNRTTRLLLVDRADAKLPIVAQCRLLKVARSSLYWRPAVVSDDDLRLMRQIDELYLATPFYGARRMVAVLRRDGWTVNSKRVRLMRIEAIYQAPDTSRRHPQHIVYSYLLRGFAIERPNQVWCADITYIPMGERLCLSGRGDGLVQPSCSGLAFVDWHGDRILCRGLAGGVG